MKPTIKILFILYIAISTAGCMGMVMDAVNQSSRTSDKTFSELTPGRDSIPVGNGRIFLYRTDDSTMSSLVYGVGIQKNIISCKLDDRDITMYWEIYLYLDLKPGQHILSCLNSDRKSEILNFTVKENENLYIRVDARAESLDKRAKRDDYEDEADDEYVNIKVVPVLANSKIAKNELKNIHEFIGDKTKKHIR